MVFVSVRKCCFNKAITIRRAGSMKKRVQLDAVHKNGIAFCDQFQDLICFAEVTAPKSAKSFYSIDWKHCTYVRTYIHMHMHLFMCM